MAGRLKELWKALRGGATEAPYSAIVRPGQAVWTRWDFQKFAREAYQQNPVVYRAINIVADSIAGMAWVLYDDTPTVDEHGKPAESVEVPEPHPLLDLWKRPNPLQGRGAWLRELVVNWFIGGETFVLKIASTGGKRELYNLRPDLVVIRAGETKGAVQMYEYRPVGGPVKEYAPEDVLHISFPSPTDEDRGQSTLSAVARSIDVNNAARAFNKALLDNGAVPGLVIRYKRKLTDPQFKEAEGRISEQFKGFDRAGNSLVVDGDAEVQNVSFTPEQMALYRLLADSARDIAVGIGVPPELVGDVEHKTYSNMKEARAGLYTELILPLLDILCDEFNDFVTIDFGENLRLRYDKDEIEALIDSQGDVWTRAMAAYEKSLLSKNEARAMVGYGEVEGGEKYVGQGAFNLLPGAAGPLGAFARPAPAEGEVQGESNVTLLRSAAAASQG